VIVVIGSLASWVAAISSLSALIVGLITALWAYTKFIVERGLLPPAQFEIGCCTLGKEQDVTLLEIIIRLKNLGSSALIATNIRLDVRYLKQGDPLELAHVEGSEKTWEEVERMRRRFGRLTFSGSVKDELIRKSSEPSIERPAAERSRVRFDKGTRSTTWSTKAFKKVRGVIAAERPRRRETRGFGVVAHDTFVQPGVDQQYSFTTCVPIATTYVLVWASFEYAQSPKLVQRAMLWSSRRLGLIQFTLRHVTEPHTTERVFKL
jgi:hypothetical protein